MSVESHGWDHVRLSLLLHLVTLGLFAEILQLRLCICIVISSALWLCVSVCRQLCVDIVFILYSVVFVFGCSCCSPRWSTMGFLGNFSAIFTITTGKYWPILLLFVLHLSSEWIVFLMRFLLVCAVQSINLWMLIFYVCPIPLSLAHTRFGCCWQFSELVRSRDISSNQPTILKIVFRCSRLTGFSSRFNYNICASFCDDSLILYFYCIIL